MKKNKIIIPLVVVVLVSVWIFFPQEKSVSPEIEKIVKTKVFPSVVKDQLKKKSIDENEYSEKVKADEGDASFHHKIGENLYNIALGRLYYSDEKLKVLKMAKIHLMHAKKLETK